MFLALFPFPEVATVIAFLLALIYVAFGVLGTNQAAAEDISSYQSPVQVQEQLYEQSDASKISEKAYYWEQGLYHYAAFNNDPVLNFQYYSYKKLVFQEKQALLPNYLLETSLPNRAPPAV